MKKIIYIAFAAAFVLTTYSCKDLLETSSSSVVDRDFVFSNENTARSALYYGYEKLNECGDLHSYGFFWNPVWGSDIEDSQDTYSEGNAGIMEKWFYPTGTANYNINAGEGTVVYTKLYEIIAIANSLITNFESLSNYNELMTGDPNSLSDLYGQAVALRATCYWELCRWYGDVPHALKAGEKAKGLVSRFAIYDYHIKKLIEVEPHMYRAGENGHRADVMNRTYVQGLIGRICLYDGGYATRRTDLGASFNVDGSGNVLKFDDWSVEKNNAIYGRRSDWKDIFAIGKKYLQSCVDNSGSVVLRTTDPRSTGAAGQKYGNPFQYAFQQMHSGASETLADESVYEIPQQYNYSSARPAYVGRPSSGGNGAAPCIGCGQDRIQAHFYYGWFDNNDLRRDASCCVTGSKGDGTELIQSFNRSDWGKGAGIATNKWDWNRLPSPNTLSYSTSGINVSYLRISDVYLMLAEVFAALGDDANARTYLGRVHNRAFTNGTDPNFSTYISDCGSVYKAVLKERALEFCGEGVRRFDLVRTGTLPDAAVQTRNTMKAVINGIRSNGYYTFSNGNQISAYIWTKMVDAKSTYGYRLTAQTPSDKLEDPVLFPGWRGQYNDWGGLISTYASVTKTNVAIKGLFKYIQPGGTEAIALEADGYVKTNWAIDMLNYEDSYANKLFAGYSDADYTSKNPPIYMVPFTYSILLNSGITNGYGFPQK
jgi:hypothetical protein